MSRRTSRTTVLLGLVVCALPSGVLRAQTPPTLPNIFPQTPTNTTPQTPPVTGGSTVFDSPTLVPQEPFWINFEYLMWWLRGDPLPPLVTTGPASSGGILGPNTTVLFGGNSVNTQGRSGGRISAGYWLDDEQTWAVEGNFFMLQSVNSDFSASSPGSPLLSRPFYNTLLSKQDAEIVAFPGAVSGKINVNAVGGNLLGSELNLRRNIFEKTTGDRVCRVSVLGGFRYLNLYEGVGIEENLTSINPVGSAPVGTNIMVGDHFSTQNNFYGGNIGIGSQTFIGRWMFIAQGKLALGCTQEVVNINGSTTILVPGSPPATYPGGLLAQSSNSGRFFNDTFSYVPELDLGVYYAITQRMSINLGYTLLYWSNVARPGNMIDVNVNPNQLPPAIPGGSPNPLFSFAHSGLLAQGISVGLLFRY